LSGFVVYLMVFEFPLVAQNSEGLRVQVMEGSGAQNVVSRQAQRSITVRVVDRSSRPLSGATVIFTAPTAGPSGRFVNGSNSIIVFTNPQGIAMAQQYNANATPGAYQIEARAAFMGEVATVSIPQTNIAAKRSSSKFILIAAAAGGAAAAAFAAKGGGGGSEPSNNPPPGSSGPPTITLLGTTVGAPR
jgi:hypothetical protein